MVMLILKSMRPYQWYKNLVLFAGLIFAGDLFFFPSLVKAGEAFLIFCLLSGAGYVVNDVADVRADLRHHEKSKRPIASGKIGQKSAIAFSVFIFVLGNGSAFLLSHKFGWCALSYSMITILYTVLLKKLVLVDVITISVGFVVRAVAGAVIIDVYISPWLVLCAFMLSLFLALCKRKQDKSILYTPVILDHLLSITTTLVIMSYSLYTFLRATQEMMVTIPLVLYGLFRFLAISYENDSTRIELFYLDKGLLLTFFLWVLLVIFLLYV